MLNFIFNLFDSDYFPLIFMLLIILVFAGLAAGIVAINNASLTDDGLVAEYVNYEIGPDKIRVGVIWYWLPDDLITENVLGQQVKVWYEFESTERVITKVEVLN